ncbi:DUF4184 family protein [Streptomyces sp. NPDC058008]|uniref:DUF4184 family protein n=1 Tax=Streptomyces sp. NPDC058008 TaxID=3346303 RepID=UPI0036EC51FF
MPFTLSHPAAVLPLMRRPFVPAALVAGAVAPDVPYFLDVLGVSETSPQDWYGPFLNATQTHSAAAGLLLNMPFALGLVAVYRMLSAPITAVLPPRLSLPEAEQTPGLPAKVRYAAWLLLSALIGIASHLAWDSFTHGDGLLVTHVPQLGAPVPGGLTVARLLQYASTALGLAVIGRRLWRLRGRSRTGGGTDTVPRLGPVLRWSVLTLLVAAPALGASVHAHEDFHAYRYRTEVDDSRPTTVDLGDGVRETTYPSRTVHAPWGTVAEGVLTGAAKRAGACFAVTLLLYAATWRTVTVCHRRSRATSPAPSSPPTQGTT